jgi:hypothetical protein
MTFGRLDCDYREEIGDHDEMEAAELVHDRY